MHTPSGAPLGVVEKLFDNAGQVLLGISHQGQERLLPAVPETIVSFERPTKQLVVIVPEGLWEEINP